jgi:phage terminase large subunit
MQDKLTSLALEWRTNPVKFAHDVLGVTLDPLQQKVLMALPDNDRIAIRSGNGPGKTFISSIAALWFFSLYCQSCVITTAPTWPQVELLLWKEIRDNISRSDILRPIIELAPRDCAAYMVRGDGSTSPKWMMVGRSTNKKENMQGFHNPYLMFIVDEGSGVDDEIFEAIQGSQTQEGIQASKLLVIGNPTRPEGYFYEIFHKRSAGWKTFHLNSEESPRVSKKWIQQMKEEYGEGSNFYQVHVLGNFPQYGEDTLIPLHWIEKAVI